MKPRENPFRASRLTCVAFRDPQVSVEELWQRFAAMNHRAAIIGPHGSGKSTLLHELREMMSAGGQPSMLIQLRRDRRTLQERDWLIVRECDQHTILCVDGADLLTWWSWRRLISASRRAAGLLVTSHRHALLPALHHCHTTPALLAAIVHELSPHTAGSPSFNAHELFARHRGNIRDALSELYDVWAECGQGPALFEAHRS